MASRASSLAKQGRRLDNDDKSRRWRKFDKRKEPATKKDTDEEPFGDDTKFVVHQLKSAFRKLQDVGKAFNIMAPHEAYKDPSIKGLACRIHWLVEKLEEPRLGQAG
jgi:hypothetical protein